jgi:hypothetical protein
VLDGQLLAFAGVAVVLSVTPGPDMALVLRNSLRGGRPAALRTIFGIGVGLLGWAGATALDVAAVLAASATLFTVLKIAAGFAKTGSPSEMKEPSVPRRRRGGQRRGPDRSRGEARDRPRLGAKGVG